MARRAGKPCNLAIEAPTAPSSTRCARRRRLLLVVPWREPQRQQAVLFALGGSRRTKGLSSLSTLPPGHCSGRFRGSRQSRRVCREIDARVLADPDARLTLAQLGQSAGMSTHQLERAFRATIGITPRQYADAQRMRRLKSRLKKGDNVTTALYEAGYGSSSRLYERAPSHLGMTPAAYRRGGEGMHIDYTIVDSPLGRLLVGATDRGISALYLGESDAALRTAIEKEYPRAELRRDDDGPDSLGEWVEKILAHLRGQKPHLDLPTDVQATAFQRRVWEELRRIPYGTTRTYTQVARAIGNPAAVRAVARACATNPVSVVVPCHRVVREDGNLAGYRWGIGRKQALLEHEADLQPKTKTAKA